MTKLSIALAAAFVLGASTSPLLAQNSPSFASAEIGPYVKVSGAVQKWLPCAPSTTDMVTGRTLGTGTNHVHPCRTVDVEDDFRPVHRIR